MRIGNVTPLHLAVLEGDADGVQQLVKTVDLEARTLWGCTALHFAAFKGNVKIIQTLLNAGANPAALMVNGMAPEIILMDQGHFDALKLF